MIKYIAFILLLDTFVTAFWADFERDEFIRDKLMSPMAVYHSIEELKTKSNDVKGTQKKETRYPVKTLEEKHLTKDKQKQEASKIRYPMKGEAQDEVKPMQYPVKRGQIQEEIKSVRYPVKGGEAQDEVKPMQYPVKRGQIQEEIKSVRYPVKGGEAQDEVKSMQYPVKRGQTRIEAKTYQYPIKSEIQEIKSMQYPLSVKDGQISSYGLKSPIGSFYMPESYQKSVQNQIVQPILPHRRFTTVLVRTSTGFYKSNCKL